MTELGKQRFLSGKPPSPSLGGIISRRIVEHIDLDRLPAAPAVQLLPRDTFVADVAVKLDHISREVQALVRDMELIRGDVAELREDIDRGQRLATFQEKEHRIKLSRLDEMQRRIADLRGRLDKVDGCSRGDFHAYGSLEAISRKLTELSSLERHFRDVERKLELATWLFCGSVTAWLLIALAF